MEKKWSTVQKDGYCLIINEGGAVLGISDENKDAIVESDGYAFKDLRRTGKLEPYMDWRLPMEERAGDLAKRLDIEEIAGLMLYSSHQALTMERGWEREGDDLPETRSNASDLTEMQKNFLKNDYLRHVLITEVESPAIAAKWNNNTQAFTESLGHGIPVNISTDPRHGISASAEFDMGAGGDISKWPEHIGLAATFDPDIVEQFGRVGAKEYRALGIATALSPQIDLATEPRWNRFNGTFGAHPELAADMARAYCDGFQTSTGDAELEDGWGFESVNAMAKHWPGGGSGEGGRDAHFGYGKYSVFPGGNLGSHLKPFTEGAFKLRGKTGVTAAIMPYYTISYDIDKTNGENVGNSYNRHIITDMLRGTYGFDGVVCTDWGITQDATRIDTIASGKCWGVEDLSVADRHYKILMAGVDQFGGNNDAAPVLAAYKKGVDEHGEETMRKRMELSAKRLLRNSFRTGLFDNPYLDPQKSADTVACSEFMQKGYDAQLKSVVLLKNKNNILPLAASPGSSSSGSSPGTSPGGEAAKQKVFIPMRHTNDGFTWFGDPAPAKDEIPANIDLISGYFDIAQSPESADCAFVFIDSPKNIGYNSEDGYVPISLQYRPYTAHAAREASIAAPGDDRSYKGKTVCTANEPHLDMLLETRKAMGSKPVIVFIKMMNPTVPAEFEAYADAIVVDFNVSNNALMDVVSGRFEPSGLLPFILPKDMETVEKHCEDVSFDLEPYVDECGNIYGFAFGLNWSGVIKDERTEKYKV